MSADKNQVEHGEPPYFPFADPDAPEMPDWDGVEPEGDQMDDAGDGEGA